MLRPRIIPVLLLQKGGLIKSKKFKEFTYLGDPVNAARIFNDLQADELIFLDISASKENSLVSLDFVKEVGEETNMPFAAGGGIKTIKDIRSIINAGAEKVVINTASTDIDFIREAADTFGSSAITICVDVKKNFWGKQQAWTANATKSTGYAPAEFCRLMEQNGAGEIIVQSVANDGMMKGYDIDLIKDISSAVSVPVIALGGAGCIYDMRNAWHEGFVSGLAAGSMFVYQGTKKGVLINYPERKTLDSIRK